MDPVQLTALAVPAVMVVFLYAVRFFDPTRERRKRLPLPATVALSRLAVVVFVIGTFTWRTRSASDLADAPVDSAALVRLAADAVAAGLVLLAYAHEAVGRTRTATGQPVLRLSPGVLYAAYIVAAVIGTLQAVDPGIVLFRVAELSVCLFVAAAAIRWNSLDDLLMLVGRILLGMATLVGISVLVWPARALEAARGGVVPFRLVGVFPEFSANSVGMIGLLLFALGLATPQGRKLAVGLGLALIVLSQYRTGYVAVAGVLGVYLVLARGGWTKVGLLLSVPVGVLFVRSTFFETAWVRGESASHSVATLSGRTGWWSVAIDVASRSPWIGTGLSSGTRFEVLAAQLDRSDTSTIHGTWIEAYVGTGFIGTAALVIFVLYSLRFGVRARGLTMAPLLLMVAILERSVTGTSIELAGVQLMFFLIAAGGAWRAVHQAHAEDEAASDGETLAAVPSESFQR